MKKRFLFIVAIVFLSACSSSKNIVRKPNKTQTIADKIVANALQFKGVKYKFGGTSKKGMDCSGVVYVAFKKENILLPRVSRQMAKKGAKTPLKSVKKGDLLFFKTNKNKNTINHVGLVISSQKGNIQFLHATSSKGVMVSSLSTEYWRTSFVKAIKIL